MSVNKNTHLQNDNTRHYIQDGQHTAEGVLFNEAPHLVSVAFNPSLSYSPASSYIAKMTIPGSRINYSYRKPSPGNNDALVIIGSVTAGICALMIVATLILVHRRDKRERELQKRNNFLDYSFEQEKHRSESFFDTALRNNILPRDFGGNGAFVISKEESQTSTDTIHEQETIANATTTQQRITDDFTIHGSCVNTTKSENVVPKLEITSSIPNEHSTIRPSLSQNILASSTERKDIFSHRRRKTWDVFDRKTDAVKKLKTYSDQCCTPIMLSHSPVEFGIDNRAFENSPSSNSFL